MENFTDDGSWANEFNTTSSSVAFWDSMIFSNPETLAGAQHAQSFGSSSRDNIITTPQDAQTGTSSNQEIPYNLDTKTLSPTHLASQSYKSPFDEVNGDTKKEMTELWNTLQQVKRELVTVKGQFQMANSELYTIKSNHAQLLHWTVDMGETVKALLKWLAENIGANIVGQEEGYQLEDLGSWLNPGSES